MIKKLKYIAEKNFHSLDEITKLLVEIVVGLNSKLDKVSKKLDKKSTLQRLPKTEEPKKKKKLFR